MENYLKIYAGDDAEIYADATDQGGNPVNLTGQTWWISVRREDGSGVLHTQEWSLHTNATEGRTLCTLPGAFTQTLVPGEAYLWEMGFVKNGLEQTLVSGSLDVRKRITPRRGQ